MKKNQEKIVKFETAKLAHEKGFDISCRNPVNQNGVKLGGISGGGGAVMDDKIQMPTQSVLQAWLRKNHRIHFTFYHVMNSDEYEILIIQEPGYRMTSIDDRDDYEVILEQGLYKALTLI